MGVEGHDCLGMGRGEKRDENEEEENKKKKEEKDCLKQWEQMNFICMNFSYK